MNRLVAATVPRTACQLPLRKKYRDQWPALVNTVMNLRVPKRVPTLSSGWETISCTGLHGVS
jgi:hypothetical protein